MRCRSVHRIAARARCGQVEAHHQGILSRLRTRPFYKPAPVSDETRFTAFEDTTLLPKTVVEERHTPMGFVVLQNTYSWGFDPVDDLVIVEFNVVNVGDAGLQDTRIGIYSEMVTNNRNYYRNWPPGGAWFDFQAPQWDEEQRMLSNHHARGAGILVTVEPPPSWKGTRVLRTRRRYRQAMRMPDAGPSVQRAHSRLRPTRGNGLWIVARRA